MRVGIFGGDAANGPIDKLVDLARRAADDGFPSFWLPQIFGVEALAALGLIGREVGGIELGTAVVPTYPRHPVVLAQQALTTQSAVDGRLVLGIGLSHQLVIEGMYGYSYKKPVRHLREYLAVLAPLLQGEPASFAGETLAGHATLDVQGATPVPVLVAALGPKMLELTGQVADGTITWMTGPVTIASHIVPTIGAAAAAAGRPTPRVVVGLPVCVTGDVAAARERAARNFQMYGQLPSYRAMLDREGVEGPGDVAVVGDEDAVRAQVEHLAEVGATDFLANIFGSGEERTRTWAMLRSLA
ncbi:MAG TPA: LLM class F420-dependent oxidoreductase [Acidimicrobiia bacterium]|nr:LLM class F420-dependent oxidoreductase [Acidimicrobiia bacterium]